MNTWYAVAHGRQTGVFKSWNEVKPLVDSFKGAKYRKFTNELDAINFVTKQSFELDKNKNVIPQETQESLIVFTDGAASHNSKSNVHSKAAFATVWPYHPELDFGSHLPPNQPQTNNRAEYSAVIHALSQAQSLDPNFHKTLIIFTDSQLLINSLTLWLDTWKKNNWKTSNGKNVANQDLLLALDQQLQNRKVVFKHVKAHTNDTSWESRFNNKVDKLAKSHIQKN